MLHCQLVALLCWRYPNDETVCYRQIFLNQVAAAAQKRMYNLGAVLTRRTLFSNNSSDSRDSIEHKTPLAYRATT